MYNATAALAPSTPAQSLDSGNFTLDVVPIIPGTYANFDDWNGTIFDASNGTWCVRIVFVVMVQLYF